MPLPPEQQVRYRRVRVRKRRWRSWDRPRHFMLSLLVGALVGLLLSISFEREYHSNSSVLAWSEPTPPKCPPVNCCLKSNQPYR